MLTTLFVWAGTPALADEILYVAKFHAIQASPGDDGSKSGRLYTASRINVLKRQPGWLRIRFKAWHQKGAARVLYALPGKRILVAVLKKTAIRNLQPLTELTDPDTEILWKQVSYEGWIEDQGLVVDLMELWQPAWKLFITRCTVCHQRRIPKKYTANRWRSLLKVMGPRTGLPKPTQHLILKFLQYHASDTSK